MKKLLFLTSILCSGFTSLAQSWAPNIGTYWYHTKSTDMQCCSEGYIKDEYHKDSLIAGINCQAIRRYNFQPCNWFCGQAPGYNFNYFTYTNANKVVYVNDYLSTTSVQTQTFDTLFYFNAPIGYQWHTSPVSYTNCTGPKSVVTVLDTGHRVIQGANLKWQKVSISTFNGIMNPPVSFRSDTIFERFGYLRSYIFSPYNFCFTGTDLETVSYFRCYGDNQIINFKYGHNKNCDYVTGLKEEQDISNLISIFPNPTADILNIEIETGNDGSKIILNEIKIFDAQGKLVLKQQIKTQHFTIDVSNFDKGFYIITFTNGNIVLHSRKLIID